MIKKLEVDEMVFFKGLTDQKKIYSEIKILVHTFSMEPFGRVFIESAAAGIPCVAVEGGGASEIVNKNMGFIFNENKPEKMVDKIFELINDNNQLLALSKTARKESKKYLSKNIFKELIPFYKKITYEKHSN